MSAVPPEITGVILAGGRATRMDGLDKGLIELAGRSMIEHVIDSMRPQVDHLMINANRNHQIYQRYGVPLFADSISGFSGPLAGITAALEQSRTDLVLMAPCDGPWLPKDLLIRLYEEMEATGKKLCVAHDGERTQPLFGLYQRELLPSIKAYLAGGDRKLMLWIDQQQPAVVDFSHSPNAFVNVNTPEERSRIEAKILAHSD
ncbi:MAG: molybdenum cofactor guanylyltransferase MobA [Gammaproteobacteria bacterium]|nr:molybdenum cofactor guanylyltransferase MobA [Gammaproteobacteria bacterium]